MSNRDRSRADARLMAALEVAEKEAAMRERRLTAAFEGRQRWLLRTFAAGAAITTGLLIWQHFENKKLQRLMVEMTMNNVLITPNGKDFYSINNWELSNGCSEYEVRNADLWEKRSREQSPVLRFKLPEQEGCTPK